MTKQKWAPEIAIIIGVLVFMSVFIPCYVWDTAAYKKALKKGTVYAEGPDPHIPYLRTIVICFWPPIFPLVCATIVFKVEEKIEREEWL